MSTRLAVTQKSFTFLKLLQTLLVSKMRASAVMILVVLVAMSSACDLGPNKAIQPTALLKTWYQQYSKGDPITAIFWKCAAEQIALNGDKSGLNHKSTSKFKWLPFITSSSSGSLESKGTYWEIENGSLFKSTSKAVILDQSETYLIIQTCPNGWFIKESVWIYGNSRNDFSADDKKLIAAALGKINLSMSDFRSVTQNGC
ncbi:Hypothetical protein NTJ_03691 [Nesidiocoris tenuis]|uniref:Lipocalin/cytosolic fatty-acid binding domain-containing protein n=1 Tax=Nesidiocoris tenuis TaxID=355587 RepID=A0ABN7AF30_9HEMI|nr:Hypothetical protein NTJ_03691 [Nesidiocoris tenuis]